MKWFWGSLLILIGLILLGINLSLFNTSDLTRLWEFWPVLLILYGLSLFSKNWKLGWLVMLGAFWAAVLLIYDIAYSPEPVIKIDRNQTIESKSSEFSADVGNSNSAKIKIEAGAVNLTLSQTEQKLIEGKLDSSFAEPNLEVKSDGNTADVRLNAKKSSVGFGKIKNDLDVRITNKIPVDLTIDSGASSLNLDLSKIILTGLEINSGASSLKLKVGPEVKDGAEIVIKAGASSMEISLPQGVGAKINATGALSSRDIEGYTSKNNSYQSINYDSSPKKITINIEAAVSSMKVKTY